MRLSGAFNFIPAAASFPIHIGELLLFALFGFLRLIIKFIEIDVFILFIVHEAVIIAEFFGKFIFFIFITSFYLSYSFYPQTCLPLSIS